MNFISTKVYLRDILSRIDIEIEKKNFDQLLQYSFNRIAFFF